MNSLTINLTFLLFPTPSQTFNCWQLWGWGTVMHGYQWPFSTMLNESQNAGPQAKSCGKLLPCLLTCVLALLWGCPGQAKERRKQTQILIIQIKQVTFCFFRILRIYPKKCKPGGWAVFVGLCQRRQTCWTVDRVHEHLFQRTPIISPR